MITPQIELFSGGFIDIVDPKPEQIKIKDIGHALSMQCRFVGQIERFYSVAEHSWHVARMLEGTPYKVQLAGLLHDASEAYLGDIASPIKQFLPDYQKMEDRLQAAIFARYDLEYPTHPAVKLADRAMLSTEAWHLVNSQGSTWDLWQGKRPKVAFGYKPIGMQPDVAYENFIEKFGELLNEIRIEDKRG